MSVQGTALGPWVLCQTHTEVQTDTQAYMHSHIGIHAFLHTYMYVHLQQPSSLRVKPCPFPVVRLAFHGAPRIPALGLLPCDC